MRIDAAGHVHLAASLADGTRVSQSAPLSSQGLWGLYVPLYGGQGSLLSWLTFTNRPTDDFNGGLSWIKPANRQARYYPGGFTNQCQALGSAYVASRAPLGLTSATVSFGGGDLAADFANAIAFSSSGRLSLVSTNRLQFSLSPSTGLFHGSVVAPQAVRSAVFNGVVFQRMPAGYGFLLGTGQSSRVSLSP